MINNSPIIHKIQGYISYIYLAEYSEKILLLDSGCANDARVIANFCKNILKRPITDIKLLAVTHAHPDHAGGAARLRTKYNIPVAAHRDIDLWYANLTGFIQHKIDCFLAQFVRFRIHKKFKPVLYSRFLIPDYELADGDKLPGFEDWCAFHIPGHTLHDLALYNTQLGTLYSGDCIIHLKGKLNLPLPSLFLSKMKKTYKKLSRLTINNILPAHGEKIVDEELKDVFDRMIYKTEKPRNETNKLIHLLFIFTPQVWKRHFRHIKSWIQH